MSTRKLSIIILWSLLSGTVRAETNPLHWKGHEKLAGHIGDGLVTVQITKGFIDAYREHNLKCWAARNGMGLAINEILKRTITRNRPDNSDNKSFPSMHTMLGTVNARGWSYSLSATIALSRMGANKHYFTDVAGGFGLGLLSQKVCNDKE